MSKVDVLIPAYNSAHYLPGAIESVIAQSEPDWHIVVVDDGSTDNTREVIKPYLVRLAERITFVQQENRGLPAARNAGIRASGSPLIALLDADDVWLPNRLAATLPAFESEEVALSYGAVIRFRQPGVPLETFWPDPGRSGHVARDLYTRTMDVPCPSATFRRSALAVTGMFDEGMRATEDRDLWLRIAQHFRVMYIPEPLAWYRLSSGSMSTDLPRMLEAQTQFVEKHYGEPDCGWTARREALARVHKQQAESYADRGEFGASLRNAIHALTLAPWRTDALRTTLSIALRTSRLKG